MYALALEEGLTGEILEEMKAVSYTHLDVYKRQALLCNYSAQVKS